MRQKIVGYLAFMIILTAAMFIFPTFFLSDAIEVCLAVMAVSKVAPKLSSIVLGAAVVALTAGNTIVTSMWIGDSSILTVLSYFYPVNFNNLINFINLVSPTCVLFVAIKAVRSSWWQSKIKGVSAS